MEQNEQTPKPIVNIKDFKDLVVKCADCEKDLLHMVRVRDSEKNYKLIAKCPFCEGESWLQELIGDYFQRIPDGLQMETVSEEGDVLVYTMKRSHDD